MQIHLKFEAVVEKVLVTIKQDEVVLDIPKTAGLLTEFAYEDIKRTQGRIVDPGPEYTNLLYEETPVHTVTPKTLYEVFDEAGELDNVPLPPLEIDHFCDATKMVEPKKTRKMTSDLHRFDEWYKAYPRKSNRGQAEKAWLKLQPDDTLIDTMLRAVEIQKKSADWTKDGGTFIPHPGTWLNNKRWLDEVAGYIPTESLPWAHKPWAAFIKEGQPHEVLNLMVSVGLDDADAVIDNLQEDGLEATCDWLWSMRAAE